MGGASAGGHLWDIQLIHHLRAQHFHAGMDTIRSTSGLDRMLSLKTIDFELMVTQTCGLISDF